MSTHSFNLMILALVLTLLPEALSAQETVHLQATADAGVSSMMWQGESERIKSWGKHHRFKLKSIQEMALVRFDAAGIKGRTVKSARLFLRYASDERRIRFIRISTVNNDWVEGNQEEAYGPSDGSCFDFADWNSKTAWAWPESQLCDVVLGSGYSLTHYAEIQQHADGWFSVDVSPELIYAMCIGDSDGLALQEGGDLALANNWIFSREEAGSEPYLEITVGEKLTATPSAPVVTAEPGTEVSTYKHGAIKLRIAPSEHAFCWKIKANAQAVERWQVPHPQSDRESVFYLEYLDPAQTYDLEITAVSAGGQSSEAARLQARASELLEQAPSLGTYAAPVGSIEPVKGGDVFSVWALPGLVKVSPQTGKVMFGDTAATDGYQANAAWDGRQVSLQGCRGEYVSCQLIIEKAAGDLNDVQVSLEALHASGGAAIRQSEIELYKNWYAKNKDGQWQPAYCVPLQHGAAFQLPDPQRKVDNQHNQGIYIDMYIPKDALPELYRGVVNVTAGGQTASLPVELEVFDFLMPDKLTFWPQLNSYGFGGAKDIALATYQLAHQHRNVFFYRRFRPKLSGSGKEIKVDWTAYDRQVGPLLSGEAFKDNRRAGVPTPVLGLPFMDSWPTELTPETYNYDGRWVLASAKGQEFKKLVTCLNEHYMTCPPIEQGLTQEYKDAFVAVQRQFTEHFKEKGWDQTEAQCLFMGKKTHRIQYKVNMWWTTDEPYHWVDWLALRFFARLWTQNRGQENAAQWVFRSDISRPQWQGDLLHGIVDNIHFGGAINSTAGNRRVDLLCRNGGFDRRVYGGPNQDNTSNYGSISWFANAWMFGANAALPWASMGTERALDNNDSAQGGYAMIVPAQQRLGVPVVADMRLKAFRDGQQLIEYLTIYAERYNLSRKQVEEVVNRSVPFGVGVEKGAAADNADALHFNSLQAWQIVELKKALAKAIVARD